MNDIFKAVAMIKSRSVYRGMNSTEASLYGWDIITCIRSCDLDVGDDLLKMYTVERVRAITGITNGVHNPTPLTKSNRDRRDKLLLKAGSHFRSHYKNAARAIKIIYGYDLINEKSWPCCSVL